MVLICCFTASHFLSRKARELFGLVLSAYVATPKRKDFERFVASPMRIVARQHATAFDAAITAASSEHGVFVWVRMNSFVCHFCGVFVFFQFLVLMWMLDHAVVCAFAANVLGWTRYSTFGAENTGIYLGLKV